MKKIKVLAALLFAGVLAMGLVGCGGGSSSSSDDKAADSGDKTKLVFYTGSSTGTYYGYGNTLAQYATNGDYGLEVTALTSDGSKANIQALQDGDANLAFCQSDVMDYAYNGTNIFEGDAFQDFSVVADMYQEQVQIVTCNPDIKSVEDLRGKKVSVGAANSGVYFNAVDILAAYDMTMDDIDPNYQNFDDSANSLKDETIDAAFIVAGAPTTAITDLSASKEAYLISLDEEHIEKLLADNPFYKAATIPAETYGNADPIETVSVGAVIIVSNDVPEEAVYELTKSFFDGKEDNAGANAKYDELNLEEAASVKGIPYSPGAAKYYEEQGVDVAAE